MSLQTAVDLTEAVHLFHREKAFFCQLQIKHRSSMSFTEHDLIAASVIDILRRDICVVKIKVCKDLAYGKRSARMSGLSLM